MHMPQVHQRRKFDSRGLLNQTASTAVNVTIETSENVCVSDILGSVYPRLLPGSDGFLKIRYIVATN